MHSRRSAVLFWKSVVFGGLRYNLAPHTGKLRRLHMRRVVSGVLAVAMLAGLGLVVRGDDKPKYTVKEVMAKAHKGAKGKKPLAARAAAGQASDEEKKLLVELYEEMAKNKPPKGDAESWKKLNDELVAAAKDVAEGKDGAGKRLGNAMKCGPCHDNHKGT